ncbi:hypothetical protein P875_00053630 [Aspergillus parasiticus SU-1]|uniref:Uncharacterized protein n=1 Tax=Aspergillus parasiticus (strain ATCC 56775 / NRRL 5862 / SRRC 143 / SU-1) TaxID=1403190 RepID=A0A0F0HZ39_ASPPU|nr:hypothetical protein P875_00053630 [Aspergillus parasiticus SU-1]
MTVSNMSSRPLQVCLSASKRVGMLVSASDASYEDRQRAEEAYHCILYQYTGGPVNLIFFSLSLDLGSKIHKAIADEETKPSTVDVPANDHMTEAFFEMFNPDLPIHLVQSPGFFAGQFKPGLMQAFLAWVEKRTGMRPRSSSIGPASPSSSPKKEETIELIHQVGLQMLDFSALSPEIVRHLALSGTNDARTRLLMHDKQILRILHQELDGLVTKHRILTEEQANLLRHRIVPTIIPRSPEAKQLLDLHREGKLSKDDFIIKLVRDARGLGIKFGDELSESSEWGGNP